MAHVNSWNRMEFANGCGAAMIGGHLVDTLPTKLVPGVFMQSNRERGGVS